ncbi:PREDICTED: neuromedin-U [Miniopterus natalensis]|uniref:neuromedin-U n=1 Tax=Miniopterus natalensis TaxID=291302 RepID=UPI0007A71AAC|nr:PREDICTED: neuromedin-U [Miniopterus natalensis]
MNAPSDQDCFRRPGVALEAEGRPEQRPGAGGPAAPHRRRGAGGGESYRVGEERARAGFRSALRLKSGEGKWLDDHGDALSFRRGRQRGSKGGNSGSASALRALGPGNRCCGDLAGHVAQRSVRGAPVLPQELQPEEELQLWNEIEAACSSFLSTSSQPQASNALEELCFRILGTLPKPQETDEKVNTKRFLFHYSKTRKLGNSNVVSSVVHPLLQLVPQLHERRMKRFKVDEEFQGPFGSHSRRYFLFRPRNGKRSEGYI